jgi:hypothetical protein
MFASVFVSGRVTPPRLVRFRLGDGGYRAGRTKEGAMGRIKAFALGAAAGMGFAYYFDPDVGEGRRRQLVDMASARLRRTGRELEREARYREGQLEGVAHRLQHPGPADVDVDDATLKDRIESEVFGPDFPHGEVNLTVVDGVVELRGQVGRPEDMEEYGRRVRGVPGVVDVVSMLHLPGEPAPNKRESREAG